MEDTKKTPEMEEIKARLDAMEPFIKKMDTKMLDKLINIAEGMVLMKSLIELKM